MLQSYMESQPSTEKHIAVVEALSRKRMGLTRKEIEKSTGIANGVLTKMLKNLSYSGFVRVYAFYGRKKRETLYQLADYYTAFYFRFIRDNYGKDEHFWSNTFENPSRRSWAGLTFEQVCKDHIPQIKHSLGIGGVLSEESAWFYRPDPEDGEDAEGAQVDLLIDRRDRIVNICEIKFASGEYEIDKAYDRNLRNKVETFIRKTGCRKTIQLTMISTYGVKRNMYSGLISNQVRMEDLFGEG